MKYKFFIAGRARNKDNILKICDLFDKYKITYYCFLKEDSYSSYGTNMNALDKQQEFESLSLKSKNVLNVFKSDMEAEKNSENFLLVLPAGKSGHIEAGVAYGTKNVMLSENLMQQTLYTIFLKKYLIMKMI